MEERKTLLPLFHSSTPGGGAAAGTRVAVRLGVWDVRGRVVRWLVAGEVQGPGVYGVIWDGKDERGRPVSSGVYLYRLEVAGRAVTETRRMVLVK
jgi:hypothetical protein